MWVVQVDESSWQGVRASRDTTPQDGRQREGRGEEEEGLLRKEEEEEEKEGRSSGVMEILYAGLAP